MILATHAIVGTAVASFFPEKPIIAFVAGFASHFLLDAIPHWEYKIQSGFLNPKIAGKLEFNRGFLHDMFRIGSDIAIGSMGAWLIFSATVPFMIILIGVIAGILPDPLQILFTRLKFEPFVSFQRFHERIQIASPIYKNNPVLGVTLQVIFVVVIIIITKL